MIPLELETQDSGMRKVTRQYIAAFVLVALFLLTGCERTVSGSERDTVLAFSEPTVDTLLAGWAAADYAAFSRNFDTAMQEEIPAKGFAALKQDLDDKLGNYVSRSVDRVHRADEFYVVDYQAKFGHAEPVKITVAFHASDHSIAFLAFDAGQVTWSTFH